MSGQKEWSREHMARIGGIRVVQTVLPRVVNLDDPDVRYIFATGCISAGADYQAVMARGQAKAELSYDGLPDSLTAEAVDWAKALAPFSGTELQVTVDGRRGGILMGQATVAGDASLHFRGGDPAVQIRMRDEPATGDGPPLEIEGRVAFADIEQPISPIERWIESARQKLITARTSLDEVAETGVTVDWED